MIHVKSGTWWPKNQLKQPNQQPVATNQAYRQGGKQENGNKYENSSLTTLGKNVIIV
jgi:hypothetical protein